MRIGRRRRRAASEVTDEVRLHLELRVEALMAEGRTRADAEREARERFGPLPDSVPQLLASARRRDRKLMIADQARTAWEECRQALRQILRTPALTLGVVVTLALGLGANATMYAVVVRLLFTPPPHVTDIGTLLELAQQRADSGQVVGRSVSYPAYKAIRDTGAFAPLAAMSSPVEISLGRGPGASPVWALFVNAEYFRTLGAAPHRGRFFDPSDDVEPVGPNVAVVSHAVWQRVFANDPAIVGRAIDLGRASYTVVGVAPPGFRGVTLASIGIWIPITAADSFRNAGPRWTSDRRTTWLRLLGRIAPGMAPPEAEGRATAALQSALDVSSTAAAAPRRILLRPVATNERGFGEREDLRIPGLVTGMSLLVLVIACVNVTHLLIARAARRQRETAIALALGARTSRLVMRHVLEAAILCLLGAVATLAVVHWGNGLVRAVLFTGLDDGGAAMDAATVGYVLLVGLAAGIVIGLGTAWRASRGDVVSGLKAAGRTTAGPSRGRTALVGIQAALSMVLLIGTGLFLLSVRHVEQVPIGLNPHGVLFATMNLRGVGFTADQSHLLFSDMEARLRAVPGVDNAATAVTVPFWSTWGTRVAPAGREARGEDPNPWINAVSPTYFDTIGTRIVQGRGFTDRDSRSAPRVIVVNEALARVYWPDGRALGQCLQLTLAGDGCAQIVGIAEHVVQEMITGGDRGWEQQVYVPLGQAPAVMSTRVVVVRAGSLRQSAAVDLVRRTMETTAPGLAGANVRAFTDIPDLSAELRPWRLGSTMFATFGTLALTLAAIGLYGLISFSVSQRGREFGVRMALGASRRRILALVVRNGVAPLAAGGLAGAAAVLLAAPLIEPLLFRTSPREPVVFGTVTLVLLATALGGSLRPALRAMRVDPAIALRAE